MSYLYCTVNLENFYMRIDYDNFLNNVEYFTLFCLSHEKHIFVGFSAETGQKVQHQEFEKYDK